MTRRQVRSAFTLLEVLLVITIIVAIAALALPGLVGRRESAKVYNTQIEMKSISDALEYFKTDLGRYPTTEEGLKLLRDSSGLSDETETAKWKGPYLKKLGNLVDAWGHEYRYTCPGEKNEKGFDLSSDGPDGQQDTDDDIVNWEKETK